MIVNTMSETNYIPGICNINRAEIAYRKRAMWSGVAGSAAVLFLLIVLNTLWWVTAAVLFLPVYIACIGYLQVKNKFCVSYGATGRQHADENGDPVQSVSDVEALRADRAKTMRMNLQAASASVMIVVAATALAELL